jgi:hypothetical protein
MNNQELKQKFKEIFANSPLKNASEKAQEDFIDGLMENYMKLFLSNIAEELSDEQSDKLESLNTAEEINAYLETLAIDFENIAADSAFAIMQVATTNLAQAEGFVEGNSTNL